MKELSFYGCSDYVEVFWNMTDGEWKHDVIYQHVVTEADAVRFPQLKAGQTVHMMATLGIGRHPRYIVGEAVTDDFDDTVTAVGCSAGKACTELNAKVAELRVAGALYVDSYGGPSLATRRVSVKGYEELLIYWGLDGWVIDPGWDELSRLRVAQNYKEHLRDVNKHFVDNARVFTLDELVIITDYQKAEEAYYQLFAKEG